jgi:hypothetical protein
MTEDFSQNTKYTTKIVSPKDTLGVADELRRFALNEYLDTKNKEVLIGTSDAVVDEDTPVDDLLLTNAVSENTIQDEIDKTRYLKETKSYITISSAAREQPVTDVAQETPATGSLFTTGSTYYQIYLFAPYSLITDRQGVPIAVDDDYFVNISVNNNHIQFSLIDNTIKTAQIQQLTPQLGTVFDVFLTPKKNNYTLDELATAIQKAMNDATLTASPLDNLTPDQKKNMFTVMVQYNPALLPDRARVIVSCQENYLFISTFYGLGYIESAPIAAPISASDAAYVVQNPTVGSNVTYTRTLPTVYPNPNCYALSLDKAYKNVKAIRIISSEIPNTDTLINNNNYHITFQLVNKNTGENIKTSANLPNWEVYLPIGNYTLSQLVEQMTLTINNMLFGEAKLTDIFHISANENTGAFDISTNDPYVFKWNFNATPSLYWRNLYYMLGFRDSAISTYTNIYSNLVGVSVGGTTIKQPYRALVLRKSNVIWLQLNNYETIYDTFTQTKYFCRFTIGNTPAGSFAVDTFNQDVHVFIDSPLAELTQVDVRFYDDVGMPFNFNGIDHSFTLEITHHIDRVMGVDFSSRRGINDKSSYV